MSYIYTVVILVVVYSLLSASLNLILGYGGMFHMGHGGFFAIGAYAGALIAINLGLPFFLEILVAGVITALSGLIISYPSIKLKGDYLAFCTYGFGVVVYSVANNWIEVTNGPVGLVGISRPVIFGYTFSSIQSYLLLSVVIVAVCLLIIWRLTHSPYGKTIEALREDEVGALACGKNVSKLRAEVFCLGSFFAGIAGVLFVHYLRIADPSSFKTATSSLIISMVIIGGRGSFWGPLAGALLVTGIPEALRFFEISSFYREQIQNMLYSLILILIVIKRPQGLFGKHKF